MDKIYDLVIIGGGAAGYTAALYASRAGLDTLVVEKTSAGGQMSLTDIIDNYPGFDEGVDGITLGMRMKNGAERFGTHTEYAEVLSATLSDNIKVLYTDSGEIYARTVIIASGAEPKKLGVPREEELSGRGIHYCAHCDGRFYKGKTVAVIGGGNSAVSDALYLSRLTKKVLLIHRRDTLRATRIYRDALMNADNIEFFWDSSITEIIADKRVSGATLINLKTKKAFGIECDGIFVSIGRSPATALFSSELALNSEGYIIADETTKTNIPGVFAAGDVRTKELRQIVTATSDGATAAYFAEKYLYQ